MARYYINIRDIDGKTEIWCTDETLEKHLKKIRVLKAMGLLREAKIYRYKGKRRILEKVIS